MKSMLRLIWILFAVMLLSSQVFAAELPERLIEGIDPEAGLDQEVVSEIGSFDFETPLRFDQRLLELLGSWLKNLNILGTADGLRSIGLILAAVILSSLFDSGEVFGQYAGVAACLAITAVVAGDLRSMVGLGTETVNKIHTYLRMLLPGIVLLMTASGGITGAGAIYGAATLFFDILIALMERFLIPLIYLYLALSAAEAILGQGTLDKLRDFIKWIFLKLVKWLFYGFSAFLTLTGLFSGAVDAQKLKTAKNAISGMVPVVGGMVSDASQAVLNAAGMLKTSVGVYGMLAVLGICFGPFLRLWLQYIMLKLTVAVCGLFGKTKAVGLTDKLSDAFGMILGITGVCCMISMLILTLCIRAVAP